MKKLLLLLFSLMLSFNSYGEWKLEVRGDDFEGTVNYYIVSDVVNPTKPLDWPNEDANAYLYYDCQVTTMVMVLSADNLNGAFYKGDKRYIPIDLKIDGVIKRDIKAKQDASISKFLSIDKAYGWQMIEGNSVLIQLNHYSDGKRIWPFKMGNVKSFINTKNKQCFAKLNE